MSLEITVTEAVTNITSNDAVTIISEQVVGVQGPKGDTGETGPTGPKGDLGTFTPKGTWSSATAYNQYDVVTNRGKTWYATQANTNQEPLNISNTNYWAVMSFGYSQTSGWVSGNYYYIGDTVTYAGNTYYCTAIVSTSGDRATDPSSLPSKWAVLASKGDTGATGPTGQWGNYYELTSDLVFSTSPGFGTGNEWNPFSTSNKYLGVNLPVGIKYYAFVGEFRLSAAAQTTSHNLQLVLNGSNIDNLSSQSFLMRSTGNFSTTAVSNNASYTRQVTSLGTFYDIEAAINTQQYRNIRIQGFFRSNSTLAGANFYPQFRWASAAETPTVMAGSYLNIIEVPATTSISGAWYNGSWS